MTVFKAFLRILNKYKVTIILYTVILIFFAGFNTKNNDMSSSFVASKPDVLIINQDVDKGITKDFIAYISEEMTVKDIEETMIDDALFYRDVNYIIYIKEGFRDDLLKGKEGVIEVKSTKDYQASLAERLVERYLKTVYIYQDLGYSEVDIINKVKETINKESVVEVTTKLDTDSLNKQASFYNFANYTILASLVQVVVLIMSSFKEQNVNKRIIVSSMNYKKFNRYLMLSNMLFAFCLWVFYIALGNVLIGNMFNWHGFLFIINALVFVVLCLVIAFLIGSLVSNKEALNGIVNVIALGSSFLCGAFVPVEFLPQSVLKIAHILPSYWFVRNNEFIKTIEVFNKESASIFIGNLIILSLFIILFIVLINVVTKRKRKIS